MDSKNGIYHEIGCTFWLKDNKLHREDGPACEWINGDKEWYLNGERHRADGPACEYLDSDDGIYSYEWFLCGKRVAEQEVSNLIEKKKLNERLHSTLLDKNKIKRPKI